MGRRSWRGFQIILHFLLLQLMLTTLPVLMSDLLSIPIFLLLIFPTILPDIFAQPET
jgi:hypothetical protein